MLTPAASGSRSSFQVDSPGSRERENPTLARAAAQALRGSGHSRRAVSRVPFSVNQESAGAVKLKLQLPEIVPGSAEKEVCSAAGRNRNSSKPNE